VLVEGWLRILEGREECGGDGEMLRCAQHDKIAGALPFEAQGEREAGPHIRGQQGTAGLAVGEGGEDNSAQSDSV
jgi:hypothetical protein